MTRVLGFLTGLLLVIALAFVVLRYPPAGLPGGPAIAAMDAADSTVAAAAQEEPALATAAESTLEPTLEPTLEHSREQTREPIQASAREADQEPVIPSAAAETLARVDDPPPVPVTQVAAEVSENPGDDRAAPAPDADEPARQWHAFWQPFHSEISAEGFRRRLEGVTGLDYRVVSPRPGEYQVAFAYRNEAERQERLAAIEAATGLVLRSGML